MWLTVPRHQLAKSFSWMVLDQTFDNVAQPSKQLDVVQLCGLDQRCDHRPPVRSAIATREQRILAPECNRSDSSFDWIVVQVDAAVVEKPGQRGPSPERVADCLS